MKARTIPALLMGGLLMAGGALAQPAGVPQSAERAPHSAEQKFSYAIAVEVARRFADYGLALDVDMAMQGFRDGMEGRSMLSEDELRRLRSGLQSQTRQRAALDRRLAPLRSLRNGEAFMLSNAAIEGVQTLPGGIQFKVIGKGSGEAKRDTENLLVRFQGRLLDGKPIGGIGADKPERVRVSDLLPGLQQVFRAMSPGAKWTVWIPAELGYGARGNGDAVPPHEVLVFDVEHAGSAQ